MSFPLEKAVSLLEEARDKNRLAHAYLITGPVGSGKEDLALRMIEMAHPGSAPAQSLDEVRSGTTTVIGPESKSRRITIEAIRKLEHTLQMAAPDGVTKFAVVRDADRMGPGAENAFLKTLEEPPSGSRLLLLTSRPEVLLDTILSRCIRIHLAGNPGPVDLSESARAFLDHLKDHTESNRSGISGALGLMSRFATILKEEKTAIGKRNDEAYKSEVAHYRNKAEADQYLKQREESYKALTEAEYQENRNRMIDYLMMWFGDAMRQQHQGQHLDLPDYATATAQLAQRNTIDQLAAKTEAIDTLRAHLNTNVFEALALEVGFIRAFA
ncbi:MAG: DNA polymerase III subunit delta' C-terminal domain-containing protein [Verrucomicrobiales bacterium]|nr:DNA polymerase III subunit delta' C-terminal domain-containing protein [Verrucomicrobiales bacterium]